jgi:AcrR family transcriptional regulator
VVKSVSRSRPTREETQARLYAAAAAVIEREGVDATTIDQIVTEAGFTRGAFYSNFETKEDLLISMLELHLEHSALRTRQRLDTNSTAEALAAALRRDETYEGDPLHQSPIMQLELMLHVSRSTELRPLLARRLRAMRNLVGETALAILTAADVPHDLSQDELGTMLIALEDGLRLHHIFDPATTPDDAFTNTVERLVGLLDRSEATPS